MIFADSFLALILYSFIGWVYESALCSVIERKLVNRGFLNGPVCPIYGVGALAAVLIFYRRTENIFLIFFAGSLITCSIEYFTGYLMEKLFHAKWWDYSGYRFNIKGRVSLAGAVVFGVLCVLLILSIHPAVVSLMAVVPWLIKTTLAACIMAVFCADIFMTVKYMNRLNDRLFLIQTALNGFFEKYAEKAGEFREILLNKYEESPLPKPVKYISMAADLRENVVQRFEKSEFYNEHIKTALETGRHQGRRIAAAFPKLHPLQNYEAWLRLRSLLIKNGGNPEKPECRRQKKGE